MPLISTAILAICAGAQGNYNQACLKALEAGGKQTGVYQNAELAEHKTTEMATNEATAIVGKDTMSVVGGGVYIYKVARDKSVTFKLPTLGVCDSLSNQITPTSYTLNVGWHF